MDSMEEILNRVRVEVVITLTETVYGSEITDRLKYLLNKNCVSQGARLDYTIEFLGTPLIVNMISSKLPKPIEAVEYTELGCKAVIDLLTLGLIREVLEHE